MCSFVRGSGARVMKTRKIVEKNRTPPSISSTNRGDVLSEHVLLEIFSFLKGIFDVILPRNLYLCEVCDSKCC